MSDFVFLYLEKLARALRWGRCVMVLLALAMFFLIGGKSIGADDPPQQSAAIVSKTSTNSSATQQVSSQVAPTDSPTFRGTFGNGVMHGDTANLNLKWDETKPKEAWTAELGTGFSSFSVVGNRAISTGNKNNEDTVWCFDLDTGKELWKHSYPSTSIKDMHEGGTAATTTIDGDAVYVYSTAGEMHCLNLADGKPRWSKQLAEELGVHALLSGFTCTPRVWKDYLILDIGHTVAVNKKNGNIVWKTKRYMQGYGSPTIFEYEKKPLVAVLNNQALFVVQLEDGKLLAETEWLTQHSNSCCTPIVHENQIYIATGNKKGCGLYDFNGTELKQVYFNKVMRPHMQTCVLVDGYLYGIDGQSFERSRCKLICQELATGKLIWSKDGFGTGSTMAAGDTLFVLSDQGALSTVELNNKGFKQVSKPFNAIPGKGKYWTPPVLSNGRLLIRNAKGKAVCLDLRK